MKKLKRFVYIIIFFLGLQFLGLTIKPLDLFSAIKTGIITLKESLFDNNHATTGYASFYGDKYAGRKTSSGAVFSQEKLTAAHNTLPFGTHVKVTNLKNGRTVVVEINDRGPFAQGRIIDLSKAAARQLGMMGRGITKVRLDILD